MSIELQGVLFGVFIACLLIIGAILYIREETK